MPAIQAAVIRNANPAALAFVADRIINIVTERSGIKEVDLALDIMLDLNEHGVYGEEVTTATIFDEIQRMVREGRIIGLDCQIGEIGYTFLLPATTQIRTVVPIQDTRTRH